MGFESNENKADGFISNQRHSENDNDSDNDSNNATIDQDGSSSFNANDSSSNIISDTSSGKDADDDTSDDSSGIRTTDNSNISNDNDVTTRQPIRVGFVSTHFYEHSIGRMLFELMILMHEKGKAQLPRPIEIFVFFADYSHHLSSNIDDTATIDYSEYYCKVDVITTILRQRLGNSKFRCLPTNLHMLQQEISKAKLDFLIFADLGMDFITYVLAHSRLATYQVCNEGGG